MFVLLIVTETLKMYEHIFDPVISNSDYGYTLNQSSLDLGIMFLIAIGWRILAYVAMVTMNKQKQR